jgi:uncharacterized protein (DUF58 family)
MLYPDFNELVAFKDRKSDLWQLAKKNVRSIIPGNHHSPFRGQGLEFDSVREYVPGDDIRNIDWRVTARTGSPHLKLFKQERERHIVICVDMNASMRFGTRKTFKSIQAARIASLIGWQGAAQHDRISACLFGDVPNGIHFFPPARTRKSLCGLLKMLASQETEQHEIPLRNILLPVSQAVHTGSLIYLISDFMDIDQNHPFEAELRRLNKKGDLIFIAVNDQADMSILPVGTVRFCSNETEKINVNTGSLAGKAAYEAQWRENRKQLYETTSRCKIPLIELTTESDVRRDLVLGLKMLAKRKTR